MTNNKNLFHVNNNLAAINRDRMRFFIYIDLCIVNFILIQLN